jgi:hypothetical protein
MASFHVILCWQAGLGIRKNAKEPTWTFFFHIHCTTVYPDCRRRRRRLGAMRRNKTTAFLVLAPAPMQMASVSQNH